MQSITFDCRQLDQVDWTQHIPIPIGRASARRRSSGTEGEALKAALRLGGKIDNNLKRGDQVMEVASTPAAARLLTPASMPTGGPIVVNFSKSAFVTGAFGISASAAMGVGVLSGAGVYASSTREIGVYSTFGGGIFLSPGASAGGEWTVVYGTPADFAGLYFGVSVGGGVGVLSVGGTLLFSPTLPLAIPMVLTLMGFSIGISASTPGGLPVNVAVTVTNTKISALRRW